MRTDITFCLANLMEISVLQNFSKNIFTEKLQLREKATMILSVLKGKFSKIKQTI
jgi:hypothetical protein